MDHEDGVAEQAARTNGVYRHEFVVGADVIDANGHVNNVAYVQWMQDVAVCHFTSVGGVGLLKELGGTWVARAHRIEYLRPAFAGDRIEARTWVADLRRVRSHRHYEFVRVSDRAVLARGETDWVLVDVQSGKPKSIPEAIRRAFTLVPETGTHR
jgi:acyl-CoA thioester hydrolase